MGSTVLKTEPDGDEKTCLAAPFRACFGHIHVHAKFPAGRVKEINEAWMREASGLRYKRSSMKACPVLVRSVDWLGKGALKSKPFKYKTKSRGKRGQP